MAQGSFLRRPDGIIEIERHGRLRSALGSFGTMLALLAVLTILVAVCALHVVIGAPLLLAFAGFFVVRHHVRQRRQPAKPPIDLASRRGVVSLRDPPPAQDEVRV
jgi:hypothetical protein